MVVIDTKFDNGEDTSVYLDDNLKKNLDEIKHSVQEKGWDYIGIIAGIPGVGKSTIAQQICKFLDPTFNTKDRICFTASGDNGLIQRTTHANLGQAFMLDESFADLNTKVSKNSEFVKLMNHLQLIRQRGLYIILCLPNFFDLTKGIAIFRSSHLFVCYHDNFDRGRFAAFGRDSKRELYVKGQKFMNYNAAESNFKGRFVKKWVADEELYMKLKYEHLKDQSKEYKKHDKYKKQRDIVIKALYNELNSLRKTAKTLKEYGLDMSIMQISNLLKLDTSKNEDLDEIDEEENQILVES